MSRVIGFAILVVLTNVWAMAAEPSWNRQRLEGEALSIEVPIGRLHATTPSPGRAIYRSPDGTIELLVYVEKNFTEASAQSLRQADLDSLDIELKTDVLLPDGYLIAGTERTEARMAYRRRVILSPDATSVFVIEVRYPSERGFAGDAERITGSARVDLAVVATAPEPYVAPPPLAGGKRVALVIGNGAYRSVPTLPTPANDAQAMAARLQAFGFDVVTGIDVDRSEMSRLLVDYVARLSQADVGLFYFSGHGLQVDGHNFLLPIDADFSDKLAAFDVEARGYDLQKFLAAGTAARISVAIIDACRDNPIAELALSGGPAKSVLGGGPTKGLAVIPREIVGRGQFISFAAEPGRTAETGEGATSVFTQEILDVSREPGLDVSVLFRRVRARVEQMTNGRQSPRYVDDLTDSFVLNEATAH